MSYMDYDISIKGKVTSVMMKVTFRHGTGDVFGRYVAITPTEGGLLFSKADGPRTGCKLSHARGNDRISFVQLPRDTKLGEALVPFAGCYRTLHKYEHWDLWYIEAEENENGAC